MEIDLGSILGLGRININAAIDNSVLSNREPILQLNDKQLDSGNDAEKNSLGEYKNYKYKNRFSPVDLKLTGDFRNAEELIPDNTQMLFVDYDSKTESLMDRYGKDIIGLDDDNQGVAAEILLPFVVENLENQIS